MPEADAQTITRHGAFKEAEPPAGRVGHPQADAGRGT
jgi:hypothetical protein